MKRSLKDLLIIISILFSVIAGGIHPTPVRAASSMGLVPLALPAGWRSGNLYSVWGAGPNDLYAVGYGNNGIATVPLLYHNVGSGWNPWDIGLPAGWQSGNLFGIWGSSGNDIYAVGSGYSGSAFLPLLYHQQGGVWTAFSLTLPAGLTIGYLYGVWGSSATDVYAVGYGSNGSITVPLMYHYNGLTWSDVSPSVPPGWSAVNFRGIWGSSSSDIYAAGYGSNGALRPLVFHRDASNWTASTFSLPDGWLSGYLYGVWGSSTTDVTDVYAVGYGNNSSRTAPLLYHNDGSAWTASNTTVPAGWNSGYLRGVWGSGANDVYAVGSGNDGTRLVPLLYHNDGTGWSESSPPLPIGWIEGYLYGVWGSGVGDVYAVGAGNNGVNELPLLYHSTESDQDLVAPGTIDDFSATTGTSNGTVDLSWTAPVDDAGNPDSGSVTAYFIKYSTTPFTSWNQGTSVTTGIPAPAPPGTDQTMTVTGLTPGVEYHFAIRAQDDQYNLSAEFVTRTATANGSNQVPGKASLVSPSGVANTSRPTFTWSADTDATWYYLWVDGPSGNVIKQWYTSAQANCSGSICSVVSPIMLGAGSYTWWVQTYNSVGDGPWSDSKSFNVPVPVIPGKATLVSPSGNTTSNNPTYTWNQVSAASWYYLWVNGPSGNLIQQWYTSDQANCNGVTCSVTPATSLDGGDHTWWIQTFSDAGYGPWSDGKNFSVPVPSLPAQPTLLSPAASDATANPTYTWNRVSGATWYYLWVDGPSGNVIKKWYTAQQANCNGSTCSVAGATPGLALGSYTWWIMANNSAGDGPWSNGMKFTLEMAGKAMLVSPKGTIATHMPTYTWNQVPGSTWYYLWVNGPSGNVIQQWYSSNQANCNGTTCSVTPNTNLKSGAHTWWVQTYNSAGDGPWSDATNFTTP